MSVSDVSFEGAEWNVAMPWSLQYGELIGSDTKRCLLVVYIFCLTADV